MAPIVKSACGMCQAGCGILVELDGPRIRKISGAPDSPVNKGRLCLKGAASLEYLNHPGRLKKPLKRQGPRGSGEWKEISWDEALDTVADFPNSHHPLGRLELYRTKLFITLRPID